MASYHHGKRLLLAARRRYCWYDGSPVEDRYLSMKSWVSVFHFFGGFVRDHGLFSVTCLKGGCPARHGAIDCMKVCDAFYVQEIFIAIRLNSLL